MYYLRAPSEFQGLHLATFDNRTAGELMHRFHGKWVEKTFRDGNKKTVFVFSDDYIFARGREGDRVEIMIWKDSYLDRCR